MLNQFSMLFQVSGLSERDAANYLGVRLGDFRSWKGGQKLAPHCVVKKLAILVDHIQILAEGTIKGYMDKARGSEIEEVHIGLARNDAEAQMLDARNVAMQKAVVSHVMARAIAEGWMVQVVPPEDSLVITKGTLHPL